MNTNDTYVSAIRENQRDLWFMYFVVFAATTGVSAQKPEQMRRVTPDGDLQQQVLDNASPGDTITLAPGTCGGLITINKGGQRQAPVVVRAVEPCIRLGGPAHYFSLITSATDWLPGSVSVR